MTKQKSTIDMGKAIELTQETAKATLDGAVKSAEVTEGYVQGIYKAGYDANVDALKVAKGYWDSVTEIRKDWLNLFSSTGDAVIEGNVKMDLPYQKEAMDFGKGMFDSVSKTVSGFMPQTKSTK